MEINQVTLFKLIFFSFCVVAIVFFLAKLGNIENNNIQCNTLFTHQEIKQSTIEQNKCPEGYYPNFGEFSDVHKNEVCCVMYS